MANSEVVEVGFIGTFVGFIRRRKMSCFKLLLLYLLTRNSPDSRNLTKMEQPRRANISSSLFVSFLWHVFDFCIRVKLVFVLIFLHNVCFFFYHQSCADVKVTNKSLFPTFGRTSLGPPEKISKSVVALLKAYQWRKFIIVADTRQWTKEITLAIKVVHVVN